MHHNKLTFGEIMQSKILYFDPEIKEACLDICRTLHIDNMPAIDGKHYYELVNKSFEEREISYNQRLEVDDRIFEPDLLTKFRKNRHNVVFVFEGHVLRGVVHISDYNQDIVIQAIQDDILAFERNLRQWLILNGFKNKDMRAYFNERLKNPLNDDDKKYWEVQLKNADKKINAMKLFSDFQLFDFSSLLEFSDGSFSKRCFDLSSPDQIIGEWKGKEVLKKLRNLAMHGLNPVEFIRYTELYSIKSLERLYNQLIYFTEQSHRLMSLIRNHEDFIKSVKVDNAKKLEIIREHPPRAIWYFLGK